MVDFIVYMLLLFVPFLLCFYYERKEKKQKEHEDWIYDCRQCLLRIARSFRWDCQSLAEEAFTKYTNTIQNKCYRYMPGYMTCSFLSDYKKAIETLKEDYIENMTAKAKEIMRYYTFTSIPNFLVEEYTKEISDIYNTFRDFEYLMWKQINELKEKNN